MYTNPESEDIILFDSPPLGSRTGARVVDGPVLGIYSSDDELTATNKAARAALAYQEKYNIYTDAWYMDDHGGLLLINLKEYAGE